MGKNYIETVGGLSINGTSGTSGINGTSGTSGINGTSGTSGTSGSISGAVEQIDFNLYISGLSGTSIIISDYTWYDYSISALTFKTNSGSTTIDIRNNGVSMSGMTNISGSTTNNTYYANTNNSISVGNYVDVKINTITSATEIYGSIKTIRT